MNKVEKIYRQLVNNKGWHVIVDTNGNVHTMNNDYGVFNYCDNFEMGTESFSGGKDMARGINAVLETIEIEDDNYCITPDWVVAECREETNPLTQSVHANIANDKNYALVYDDGEIVVQVNEMLGD